ncbi:hypothetical protein P4O66_001689 [Electrophorus voltai]|uniref:DUF4939 domain-containing protein n=1 Tax=Electrophorus voltai TaxID=2609070 RepID=A0AAD8Z5G9_9TELE|nr:hypothetical protein P4O66_001689 [Electrophorus voltai]
MIQSLGQCVSNITANTEKRSTTSSTRPIPEKVRCLITTPEVFGGDTESCEEFVVQCELYFGYQPLLPDHAKVAFVISRLTGRARAWGAALVVNSSPLMNDYPGFIGGLKAVLHQLQQGRVCGRSLLRLRQGLRTTAEYATEFRTLVAGSRWNEPALVDTFMIGLRVELQAVLACNVEVAMLNEVVHLAITYNCLLQEKLQSSPRGSSG